MIDTYIRGLGMVESHAADTLLAHKDEFIDFLKLQKWTNKDMNQSWFKDEDGFHSFGLRNEENN